MKKHYVTFLSAGTFVSEQTTKEIDSWNVQKAVEMSRTIKERYGATPYGFYFTTRKRGKKDFDSYESERSGTYFLGGQIMTLEDVIARGDPDDGILISNMRNNPNSIPRVIENNNSWRVTMPFTEKDILLDYERLE